MSMHKEDWQNLWNKVRDWAKAHPLIVVGAACAVVGIAVGLMLR